MKKAVPLLLLMAGVQGWVLSLPLFGPLLFPLAGRAGADPVQSATIFLSFYALSFAAWGIVLHYIRLNFHKLLTLLTFCLSVCILLNLSLLWASSAAWTAVFIGIGIFASLPSLVWLYLMAKMIPRSRMGFALGINGVLVSLVRNAFSMLAGIPPVVGLLLSTASIVLALAMLILIRRNRLTYSPINNEGNVPFGESKASFGSAIPLFLIFFVIFLLGGIMYQVVNPFLAEFPIINTYREVPYLLAMPFVGKLLDRQGTQAVIYGMALLGLAYTSFAFSPSFGAALLGDLFIELGFAITDVFVLYALATWTYSDKPFRFIGIGLSVYILSIRVGLDLNNIIVPFSHGNYLVTYLAALGILLVSFLLVQWLGHVEPREAQKRAVLKQLIDYYSEKDGELKLARRTQEQMLPEVFHLPRGIEASAALEAAREVGGDFYDVLSLDSRKALFVIGDVTGHGLPAALIMSTVVGLIRSEVYYKHSLLDIAKQLNRVLMAEASSDMLVTLALALFDADASTITYVSCGHMSPYLVRDHRVTPIETSSLPIGFDSQLKPFEVTIPFTRGDLLVLYTDGIVEVQNVQRQMYGFERFEQRLLAAASLNGRADDIKTSILSDVKTFADRHTLHDDMTLLVIKMP